MAICISMGPAGRLLMLPHSILLLLATSATAGNAPPNDRTAAELPQWAHDGGAYGQNIRHVQQQFAIAAPIGVRKMSGDEGEKFFFEYWQFDDNTVPPTHAPLRRSTQPQRNPYSDDLDNLTVALPPYLLHEDPLQQALPALGWLAPRSLLAKRFECPSDTRNCSAINRPNSCCGTDESCVLVEDTGLGDVGCCPAGEQCGGQVSACDTGAGYTSCPDSPNGGCCIPNYTCMGVGCVTVGASTTTTTLPLATATRTVSSSSSSSTRSTSSAGAPVVTTTTTLSSTGTVTALPPGRPTGDSSSSSVSSSATSSSTRSSSSISAVVTTYTSVQSGIGDFCPTGFYACSAYYGGGCCRVGRDCQSTSCPIPATQTVVISNGVTIIAGSGSTPPPPGTGSTATNTVVGTSTIQPGGSCASGWYSCVPSDGGGCCPSGYACGDVCTATISGASESTVQKISVGPKTGIVSFVTYAVVGTVSLLGMLFL